MGICLKDDLARLHLDRAEFRPFVLVNVFLDLYVPHISTAISGEFLGGRRPVGMVRRCVVGSPLLGGVA